MIIVKLWHIFKNVIEYSVHLTIELYVCFMCDKAIGRSHHVNKVQPLGGPLLAQRPPLAIGALSTTNKYLIFLVSIILNVL